MEYTYSGLMLVLGALIGGGIAGLIGFICFMTGVGAERYLSVDQKKLEGAIDALISERPYQQLLNRVKAGNSAAEEDLAYIDYLVYVALRHLHQERIDDLLGRIIRYRHREMLPGISFEGLSRLVIRKRFWLFKEGQRVRFNRRYSYDWATADPRDDVHVEAGTIGRIFNVEKVVQGDEPHYAVRVGSQHLIAPQSVLEGHPDLGEKLMRLIPTRGWKLLQRYRNTAFGLFFMAIALIAASSTPHLHGVFWVLAFMIPVLGLALDLLKDKATTR